MKKILLVLLCFFVCTGFSYLQSIIDTIKSEDEAKEKVIEDKEIIEPTIPKTSTIAWEDTHLVIPKENVVSVTHEVTQGVGVDDYPPQAPDGMILAEDAPYENQRSMYEDYWAGVITWKELRAWLVPEDFEEYKVVIKAKTGQSNEQFQFWQTTYDRNGFSDNDIATFNEGMKVNTRYIKESYLSVGNEDNTVVLRIYTTSQIIYNSFVNNYEGWK